jgi:hypothetical protein
MWSISFEVLVASVKGFILLLKNIFAFDEI